MASAIPKGFSAVTPYLIVPDAPKEIDFLKTAFGGTEPDRMTAPDGSVAHTVVFVGGAPIMISSSSAMHGPQLGMIFIYLPDVDAAYARAAAFDGVDAFMPVTDQFWGDRAGAVKSPNGVVYWIATHTEDLTLDDIRKRTGMK
ncbi:MAG: hypothetical protein JWM57_2522 [Phycisphaerales bacterium]|nr:hypothetical protein [Phycisphaerales bacterium]